MHVNIQLSDAIGAALEQGGLDQVRVRPTIRPVAGDLIVGSGFNTITTDGRGQGGNGLQTRLVTVPVMLVDVVDGDVEAALWNRAADVETALLADDALATIRIVGIELGGDSGVSLLEANTDGGALAALTLNFNVTIRTTAGAPDTSLSKG